MARILSSRPYLYAVIAFGLVLSGWMLATPPATYACSCIAPPPPQQAMNDSDHVFTGTVVDITESSDMELDVRIEVSETWKGVNQPEVTVSTPDNSAACGFNFEEGEEYLVYATGTDDDIQVSLCSRTVSLADADEDLDALGSGSPVSGDGSPAGADDDDNDGLFGTFTVVGGATMVIGLLAAAISIILRRG